MKMVLRNAPTAELKKNTNTNNQMTTLTNTQQAAIKCAFVDLCASYKAWNEMDVYSHALVDSIQIQLKEFIKLWALLIGYMFRDNNLV